jgi:hypothetical protein
LNDTQVVRAALNVAGQPDRIAPPDFAAVHIRHRRKIVERIVEIIDVQRNQFADDAAT